MCILLMNYEYFRQCFCVFIVVVCENRGYIVFCLSNVIVVVFCEYSVYSLNSICVLWSESLCIHVSCNVNTR